MSLVSTKTPIFDDIPSIEFFNGRLLSGEDMTTEQAWNAARRKLLGQALGSGVAFGLEVRISEKSEHAGKPIVTVDPGLAVNADGVALSLADPTDVSLAQVDETEAVPAEFGTCLPTQYSAYVKADGVYLLTLCPAAGTQGRAPVSGLANQEARCNRKYRREGVQFRLHQLKLTAAELADRNRLRNLVAYKCFHPGGWQAFVTNPFAAPDTKPKLLDGLLVPKLEDSEVPLATIFWTTDRGIEHVDLWSVRRRLIQRPSSSSSFDPISDWRTVQGEAMYLQFQDQIRGMMPSSGHSTSLRMSDYFFYLPPIGLVPVSEEADEPGFLPDELFASGVTRGPLFIEGARLRLLTRSAVYFPPIDLSSNELVWIYRIRENAQHAHDGIQPYLAFASGVVPYLGEARFDVARWDYANYLIE